MGFKERFQEFWNKRKPVETSEVETDNMEAEVGPHLEYEDMNHIELRLVTPATADNLSVFIRDPKDAQKFWYRKLGIGEAGSVTLDSGKKIPYYDIYRYPGLAPIEAHPIPAQMVGKKIRDVVAVEARLLSDPDEQVRSMHAATGVAEYTGGNELTVDNLTDLIGLKYQKLRAAELS